MSPACRAIWEISAGPVMGLQLQSREPEVTRLLCIYKMIENQPRLEKS